MVYYESRLYKYQPKLGKSNLSDWTFCDMHRARQLTHFNVNQMHLVKFTEKFTCLVAPVSGEIHMCLVSLPKCLVNWIGVLQVIIEMTNTLCLDNICTQY